MRRIIICLFVFCLMLSLVGFRYDSRNRGFKDKNPTGSAKYLDGRTVLVSIYIEDKAATWTKKEKNLVLNNLRLAVKYLKDEGSRYSKNVNLIFDTVECPDLEYEFKYDKEYDHKWVDSDDRLLKADFRRELDSYIKREIDSAAILEKYKADSIGFLFFIDGETDMAITYPYYEDYNGTFYAEACVIPIRWSKDTNIEPASYAHEIIHLFGVPDLYRTSKDDGITKEFIDYVLDNYPDDIMLGYLADEMEYSTKITAKITDITAYFLGWKDSFPEIEKYKSVKKEARSVNKIKDIDGNYDEYKVPRRQITEEDRKVNTRNIAGGIILFCLGFILTVGKKNTKKSYDF